MPNQDVVIASRNLGKIKEFSELMAGLPPVNLLSLADFPDLPDIPEEGHTFVDNALSKARAVGEITGLLTVADDSGLEVDYLQGAPGVYSARFAGEPKSDLRNNEKLLALLAGVRLEQRMARFRCAIAIVTPKGREIIVQGLCEGLIGFKPVGGHGFGYDPLFYIPELGKTMAELGSEQKNMISHRARAFQEAGPVLRNLLSRGELDADLCVK